MAHGWRANRPNTSSRYWRCFPSYRPLRNRPTGSDRTLPHFPTQTPGKYTGSSLCYDLRIMIVFDWPAWHSEVPFDQRPELIDTFDRTTCCMALTALVRGDRFNEGLVAWAWANGLLERIVGRLKVLLEDIGLV